jgi:hypothetical protein
MSRTMHMETLKFLGYIITQDSLKIMKDRIEGIKESQLPKSIKDI